MATCWGRHARSRPSFAAVSASLAASLVALILWATDDVFLPFLSRSPRLGPHWLVRPKPPAATGRQLMSIWPCESHTRSATDGKSLRRPSALTRLAASSGSAEIKADAEFQKALIKLENAAFKGKVHAAKEIYPEVFQVCPPGKRAAIEVTMLKAFGRARKCREARAWFEKIIEEVPSLQRNLGLWRALLDSYAQLGRWMDTEELAKKMRSAQVEPDAKIYGVRMQAFAKGQKHTQVAKLFSDLKQTRLKPDEVTYGIAMGSLGRTGQFDAAVKMLEEIKTDESVQLDVIHYGGAMNACAKEANRKPKNRFRAFELLAAMKSQGVQPNIVIQGSVVSACAEAGDVEMAREHLKTLEDEGWNLNVMCCTPVLKALVAQGRMEEAQHWLKEMRSKGVEPNVVTYNSLINGYAARGEPQEACRWLTEMQSHDVRPNTVTLTDIVKAHVTSGNVSGAYEWLGVMPVMGLKPDTIAYNIIAQHLAKHKGDRESDGVHAAEMAEDMLWHMSANGVSPNKPTVENFRAVLGRETFETLAASLGLQVQKLNNVRQLNKNTMNLGRDRERTEQFRRVR